MLLTFQLVVLVLKLNLVCYILSSLGEKAINKIVCANPRADNYTYPGTL